MFAGIQFDKVFELLKFNASDPLVFSTSLFFFLFAAFMLLYTLSIKYKKGRLLLIILFSLYFYYRSAGYFAGILVVSAVVNFFFGKIIFSTQRYGLKRLYLISAIVINIGILSYFKYTNFVLQVISDISNSHIDPLAIFLPIGISFYTFKALNYIFDIYMEMMEPTKSFRDFCVFVFFFPNILSGPIDRASNFLPQVEKEYELTKEDLGKAVFLICAGLVKKVIFSDYLADNFVDIVFGDPARFTGLENLIATYGFSLRLYSDFSGYSDIAIGIALLMGFKLMDNFNSPFRATSVADFWRRWHISLSRWLQDYLFKPLQIRFRNARHYHKLILLAGLVGIVLLLSRGNLISTFNDNPFFFYGFIALCILTLFIPLKYLSNVIGLTITFFICGLWHDAGWNFIIWGALHGFYMSVGLILQKPKTFIYKKLRIYNTWPLKLVQGIITFHLIAFSFLIFRLPNLDTLKTVLELIFTFFKGVVFLQFLEKKTVIAVILILGFLLHFTPVKLQEKIKNLVVIMPFPVKALLLALIIFLIAQIKSANPLPPIYFQF